MKFLSAIILTALLAFATGLYGILPWWSFAITSFIIAIAIHQKAGKAFLAGFAGLFLLWSILAILIDSANDHILATKVANILPLGGSYWVLILLTAIIGGLVSGLAALTGSYLRQTTKQR
ncbi:hypothetical protein [Sediminibacterium goheungense]|uniref:Uncharacterized protein n=1 Tax=Sediminibacterium goheungense TaxID=1086393 RepID=A0A4R6IZI4_9BACT|nr:hypothetical protein [Sediminibacterium goheungense]TDO28309.1 hypothetical protein BC659_0372 [Sediminibacterium goheungense]